MEAANIIFDPLIMPLHQLKETSSRWNILSKVDLLGSVDFWSLTISLDSLRPQETEGLTVKDISSDEQPALGFAEYERRKKVLTLAAHEYTHFVDATSSLWGLQHLGHINACGMLNTADETQFHILKRSYDYMRSIRLPNYYTTVNSKISTNRPWGSFVTSGIMFSSEGQITDRPIVFVNFSTVNGNRFVRSPLSTISLLEASAMAKEIEVRINLIQRLPNDERLVEQRQLNEELLNYLYDPNITEYSACFHLVANTQNEEDIGIISRGTGILVRTILNVPEIAFDTAAKNIQAYADAMKIDVNDKAVQRIRMALELKNRGALFFLIVVLLPAKIIADAAAFDIGLEKAFEKIGLSLENLRHAAFVEAKQLHNSLSNSTLSPIKDLANCGYDNFTKIFPTGLTYQLEKLSLPPSILGDEQMSHYAFNPSDENLLAKFDLEIAYDTLYQCQREAENFAEACI